MHLVCVTVTFFLPKVFKRVTLSKMVCDGGKACNNEVEPLPFYYLTSSWSLKSTFRVNTNIFLFHFILLKVFYTEGGIGGVGIFNKLVKLKVLDTCGLD